MKKKKSKTPNTCGSWDLAAENEEKSWGEGAAGEIFEEICFYLLDFYCKNYSNSIKNVPKIPKIFAPAARFYNIIRTPDFGLNIIRFWDTPPPPGGLLVAQRYLAPRTYNICHPMIPYT